MAVAMQRPARVLDRLERDTRAHHATAEGDRFGVLDEPTPATLRRWLAAIYHFEYAVEAQLFAAGGLSTALLATRVASGRLADDLLALGLDGGIRELLAQPVVVPSLATRASGLGWLYVLERNRLCHAAVHRALVPHLAPVLRRASRYLTAHARDVHARWHELATYLDRAVSTHEEPELFAAAHEAFARQHLWLVDAGVTAR
ncbi:MAG: hypothetical protein ACM31C_20140 [Acidobacteriota bacterium]